MSPMLIRQHVDGGVVSSLYGRTPSLHNCSSETPVQVLRGPRDARVVRRRGLVVLEPDQEGLVRHLLIAKGEQAGRVIRPDPYQAEPAVALVAWQPPQAVSMTTPAVRPDVAALLALFAAQASRRADSRSVSNGNEPEKPARRAPRRRAAARNKNQAELVPA